MITRRRFLENTAATTALIAAPAIVRGQNLNSRVQLASVGADGKGWSDTKAMSTHGEATHVAFCDVDLNRTLKVKELKPDAPIFQDYREMLSKMGDQIDALTVSTPDHMHAYVTLDLMRQGKHVYCQKPLTHTVWEARQVRLQAAKSGVITRLGNQIHSHTHYRTGVELIQSGAIGKIKKVESWCAATGHGKSGYIDRPEPSKPAPDSVNWDLWIGVAPMRPYGDVGVYHPWGWRDWQDFGNGALGDFGCHILDPVYTALKIDKAPVRISTPGGRSGHTGMNDEVWPAQNTVFYVYLGTEYTVGPKFRIDWYDGGRKPSVSGTHIPKDRALPRSGSIFVGEEGTMILPHVGAPQLYPEEKFADYAYEPAEDLDHYHGWIDGIRTGKQPSDGFEYGGQMTEAVLLGNIAARYRGKMLEWDAENMKVTIAEEGTDVSEWVTKDYREGWEIAPVA